MPEHDQQEGVIRFHLEHEDAPAPVHAALQALLDWHARLYRAGLIGRDPQRYGGLAYGNLSIRTQDEGFIISGSQVGGKATLRAEDLAQVTACDIEANHVQSRGPRRPSSETMTHAAVYQADSSIVAVIHVHAPRLWQACAQLRLPCTPAAIGYGTPAMANAVADIIQSSCHPQQGILCMGGHRDGVIAWGESLDQAGELLLKTIKMVRSE